MYDAEGVCGFRLGALAAVGRSYVYVKDVMGNVRSIVCAGSGEEVARYEYDAWGAVRVVLDVDVSNVLGMALGSVRVGSINPVVYKLRTCRNTRKTNKYT